MKFTVSATVVPPAPPKPKSWGDWASDGLGMVVGVPLMVVLGVLVVLVLLLVILAMEMGSTLNSFWRRLRQRLGFPPPVETHAAPYASPPMKLFQNPQLHLQRTPLVPVSSISTDSFNQWLCETTGYNPHEPHEHQGVGRLCTAPELPGLHGLLVGDLCHKWDGGLFLQTFEPADAVAGVSWLVYLDLQTLQWQRVQEAGPCLLEAVSNDPEVLRGDLPDGSQLLLRVAATPGTAAERHR